MLRGGVITLFNITFCLLVIISVSDFFRINFHRNLSVKKYLSCRFLLGKICSELTYLSVIPLFSHIINHYIFLFSRFQNNNKIKILSVNIFPSRKSKKTKYSNISASHSLTVNCFYPVVTLLTS